ncbi:MAG: PocR ligand-binding domain-containing protein [Pseudomonadota bacterium]
MKLTDIAPLDDWKKLEDMMFNKYGLEVNVFNIKGIRITDNKRWVNRLCPAIKATDKGQSFICAVAHMNISNMAKNQGEPVVEECDAGLAKIVVPIFKNDEFVGAVGACGHLLDDGEVDSFMIEKTTGIDQGQIEALGSDIRSISSVDAENLARDVIEAVSELIRRQ